MKTMHAFTAPDSVAPLTRAYRRFSYPRSAQVAEAIIINSESLRSEVEQHLEVDDRKLKLIYEAVDHELFQPGDADEARAHVASPRRDQAVRAVRLVAVAVQELRRAAAGLGAAPAAELGDRQLVDRRPGPGREVRRDAARPGGRARHRATTWSSSAGCRSRRPSSFYQAADVFVYPSLNETFGLPILEAMACGCPVVTSDTSAMPETAGGAAVLCRPGRPGRPSPGP